MPYKIWLLPTSLALFHLPVFTCQPQRWSYCSSGIPFMAFTLPVSSVWSTPPPSVCMTYYTASYLVISLFSCLNREQMTSLLFSKVVPNHCLLFYCVNFFHSIFMRTYLSVCLLSVSLTRREVPRWQRVCHWS